MSWRPEGIYQCRGCGRTYPEYVNGCIADDPPLHDRKVVCVVPEVPVGSDAPEANQ